MAAYDITINGVSVDVYLDSVEFDFDTLSFDLDLENTATRPQLDDEVVFLEDSVPIACGPITTAPEEGFGGPNLDRVVLHITASSLLINTTYRYITAHLDPGTLKAGLTVVAGYLSSYGITLDPAQVDGPDLPELTFTRQRVDNVLQQFSDLTGGYLYEITPDNKYLRMYAPGSVSAPYDILDSDTGIAKQIGDLKVEPQRNTAWANRVTLVVKGGGPPTSQETFTAADGVSSGGFTRFTTKYPASASQNDFWTNQLRFDGVVQGAIAFGEEHLVANGGLVTWAWNPTTHQLVYDEANGTVFPTGAQVIDIEYAIGYPFDLEVNDTGSQSPPTGIRETFIEFNDSMTLDAAQAYADALLAQRNVIAKKATFSSDLTGWRKGQMLQITVAARDTDAMFLITNVRMHVAPNDNIFRHEIEAFEVDTTVATSNWRDVPKAWSGGSSSASAGGSQLLAGVVRVPYNELANLAENTVVGRVSGAGTGASQQLAVGANLYTEDTSPVGGPVIHAQGNVKVAALDPLIADNRLLRADGTVASSHGSSILTAQGSAVTVADDGSLTGVGSLEMSKHLTLTGRHTYALTGATVLSFNVSDFVINISSAAFSPALAGIDNLPDGAIAIVQNTSGVDFLMLHEDTSVALGAQRLTCPGGLNWPLRAGSAVLIWRNPDTSRAQVVATMPPVIANKYVDIAYSSGNFSQDTGTWTVQSGDQFIFRYLQISPNVVRYQIELRTTSVASNPTELRVTLAHTAAARVAGSAPALEGAAAAVTTYYLIASASNVLSFTKAAGAAWAASTNQTFLWAEFDMPI
jgi:hypothetical protein